MVEALLDWYRKNARDLPWRKDYEPYHILISEFMLQQTQMERGLLYFNRWIEKFPSLFDVANALEEEILLAWEGLGYYRRARYIHEIAKKVCSEFDGIIPNDEKILKSFKGLGDYTVAALCGIAFNQALVCIDANVERVFTRLYCIAGNVKTAPAKIQIKDLAYAALPPENARIYNQALMELGALVCKKNPLCEICPLSENCQAWITKRQNFFPTLVKKTEIVREEWIELVFHTVDGKIMLQQRAKERHWGGLFEFYPIKSTRRQHYILIEKLLKDKLKDFVIEELAFEKYTYTNHRNTLSFYAIYLKETSQELVEKLQISSALFTTKEELIHFAFPSPYRKAIKKCFKCPEENLTSEK